MALLAWAISRIPNIETIPMNFAGGEQRPFEFYIGKRLEGVCRTLLKRRTITTISNNPFLVINIYRQMGLK